MDFDKADLERRVLVQAKHSTKGVRVELLRHYFKYHHPEAEMDEIMKTSDWFMSLLGYQRKKDYYVAKSL